MTKLLEIKDQLIRFYSKYETYLYPIVKFAVALALFTVINTNIGFMEKISRFPVALLLALVCACLLYTSPSPRDRTRSRMPSSA